MASTGEVAAAGHRSAAEGEERRLEEGEEAPSQMEEAAAEEGCRPLRSWRRANQDQEVGPKEVQEHRSRERRHMRQVRPYQRSDRNRRRHSRTQHHRQRQREPQKPREMRRGLHCNRCPDRTSFHLQHPPKGEEQRRCRCRHESKERHHRSDHAPKASTCARHLEL
jgi:hypothetical protein